MVYGLKNSISLLLCRILLLCLRLFLSGTFYTADRLPPSWQFLCHLNPFFYMIDGFRYGFIGVSDGTLGIGLVVMAVSNALLLALAYWMFKTGYKLKS